MAEERENMGPCTVEIDLNPLLSHKRKLLGPDGYKLIEEDALRKQGVNSVCLESERVAS